MGLELGVAVGVRVLLGVAVAAEAVKVRVGEGAGPTAVGLGSGVKGQYAESPKRNFWRKRYPSPLVTTAKLEVPQSQLTFEGVVKVIQL